MVISKRMDWRNTHPPIGLEALDREARSLSGLQNYKVL